MITTYKLLSFRVFPMNGLNVLISVPRKGIEIVRDIVIELVNEYKYLSNMKFNFSVTENISNYEYFYAETEIIFCNSDGNI